MILCTPLEFETLLSCVPSSFVHVKRGHNENTTLLVKSKRVSNHFVLHFDLIQAWALDNWRLEGEVFRDDADLTVVSDVDDVAVPGGREAYEVLI